ncbi:DUF4433 domain-containing protein [Bacillus zanthoxyli]|nr:DUF4433 domain-containing protein [Bacillus zanthoxyli]
MPLLKKDREQFKQVIDEIIKGEIQTGLATSKKLWIPKYVYHFTDLKNAISILREGYVYSRKKANELGLMEVDNASGDVIKQTDDKWKGYARFYFRPKTPTQYNNEGVRSSNQITELKAHCPVPVFFLFDSLEMITMEDSLFSYGNLAVNATTYDDVESFRKMPFSSIYHEGSYDTYWESHIKFNRHAELIIPEKCSLQHLKKIVCRSAAEKETFLSMLGWELSTTFGDLVVVDTRNNFFNGKWTYVEEVSLTKEQISLTFNTCKQTVNFDTHIVITEDKTNTEYTWRDEAFTPPQSKVFSLSNLKYPECYTVQFYLDGYLVYKELFMHEDYLPF